MKTFLSASLFAVGLLPFASTGWSADEKETKYHCEKSEGGKKVDLEDVKDRKACKEQGGKWLKGHEHDHADDKGDEHKDEKK